MSKPSSTARHADVQPADHRGRLDRVPQRRAVQRLEPARSSSISTTLATST